MRAVSGDVGRSDKGVFYQKVPDILIFAQRFLVMPGSSLKQ